MDIKYKSQWPDDREWLRQKVPDRGTPRWYVVQGQRVRARAYGIYGWQNVVVPAVKEVARAKTGSRAAAE